MSRRGIIAAGAVVVAVALAGFAYEGRAIWRHHVRAEQCAQVKALVRAQETFNARVDGDGPRVAFLGDSYTLARNASDVRHGWAPRLAAAKGWHPILLGYGGSGFAAPGPCGDDRYATRYVEVAATHPHAVVIQGGYNDRGTARAVERRLVIAGVEKIRHDLPGVPIALVGPVTPNAGVAGQIAQIQTAFTEAASVTGVTVVEPDGWFTDANRGDLIGPDGVHPTDAGYAYMARRIRAALGDWPSSR